MENAEEILHTLEEFSKTSPKYIPHELDDYLDYVAKTGDPVFKWPIIKCLYLEKLTSVIADFHEESLNIEVPPCPNVDPFNYERMKANLFDKLESFNGAPFTVQRLSELLTNPRKEYNRADKFMRAVEKNILVVSTIEPGRGTENDVDDDPSFNGVPEPETASVEMSASERLPETESPNVPYETVQERNDDDDRQVFAGDDVADEMPKAAERDVDVAASSELKPPVEEEIADSSTAIGAVAEEEEDRFMWVKSLRPSTAAEPEEKIAEERADTSAIASTSSSGQDAVALSSSDALLLDPLLNFIPVNSRWTEEEKMLGLNQMGSVDVPADVVGESVAGESIVGENIAAGEGVVEASTPNVTGDRKEFDSFLMSSNAPSSSYEASEVDEVAPKRRRCEEAEPEVAEPPSQSPEVTESAEAADSPVAKAAEPVDTSEQVGSSAEPEDKIDDKPPPRVEDEGSNSGLSVSDENVVSSCQDDASNELKMEIGNSDSIPADGSSSSDEPREATVIHTTSADVHEPSEVDEPADVHEPEQIHEPMDVNECQTTSSELP